MYMYFNSMTMQRPKIYEDEYRYYKKQKGNDAEDEIDVCHHPGDVGFIFV